MLVTAGSVEQGTVVVTVAVDVTVTTSVDESGTYVWVVVRMIEF